jgi:hypothetical protein
MKRVQNSVFGWIILVLHVDDMLIAARNRSEVDKLKSQLRSSFNMKDLGTAKKILGMEISRDQKAGKLWLTQGKYEHKVLAKFNMSNAKSVSTPLAPHFKLSTAACPTNAVEKGLMSAIPYESVVGSLFYLMVCRRPDIAYAVRMVTRYMSNPGRLHWRAVKWIMRYLKGTVGVGLLFDANSHRAQSLIGYVDSDFAQDRDRRRSTTGYVFTLAGGCISWRSMLQKCLTLSSIEAEYVTAVEALEEAIWLSGLINDLGLHQDCVNLHCDSQSALHLAMNQVMDGRTKHIDVRYHFIREAIADGKIELVKIDGKLNPADSLTKVILAKSFARHRAKFQILHKE